MKPILMIHEVTSDLLSRLSDVDLSQYILTFDDGLYSQFHYFHFFDKIPTQKIFFISSKFISDGQRPAEYLSCVEAHRKAKHEQVYEDYMSLDDIRYLHRLPNVEIGGHGHEHVDLSNITSLFGQTRVIAEDTEQMVKWFWDALGIRPKSFCFPYNNDLGGLYPMMLKKHGFEKFYGSERIDVDSLP